jgi:predicted CXXCH cytochrome family protein
MPSSFRDPKTLADWIQLDYFQRPSRVWTTRILLAWLVFILCLSLLAFTWWPETRFVYESRPVSSAHAMFNNNCGVCHVESFQPARRLLRGDSNVRSVRDDTCRSCHPVAPHHEECVPDPNCATCHQEHRGQPVLARVADKQCTRCHANLDTLGCPTRFATRISGFTSDHPAFGAWQTRGLVDPGTIRFNHRVHLNLKAEGVRGIDKPLAALSAQQCSYCHKIDVAGRYMKPINYDQHCSQCHALSVVVAGNFTEERVWTAAERFAQEPAPHKEPLTVRATLRERYTEFVRDNPAVLKSQLSDEPPRWISTVARAQPVMDKEWPWVNEQLQIAERLLFNGANGCSYCHQLEAARTAGKLPQYLPSKIKPVWFEHSIFSHERHRMLRCSQCHDAASSSATKDVLLPAIDNCRQCHNSQVGARTECAECHRYHDRAKEVFEGRKTFRELGLQQ